MDCLFCKIASKAISAKIIYEDDAALAFLDVNPRSPGHTMVIPKKHAATLLELPDADGAKLFAGVKRVDALLVEKISPDGITIGINQGKASGQAIDHLHVHLIPRWQGDGGGSIHSVVNNQDAAKRAEVENVLLG
jgi:histidine triad (HIT) family protein